MIFRFYDPISGCLKIDGQDLKTVTMESFREHVGIVPQDATLFNTTIMENVRYSKMAATDEEVMNACKTAAIHDQVLSFKHGYQTVVGENGVRLSGFVDSQALIPFADFSARRRFSCLVLESC